MGDSHTGSGMRHYPAKDEPKPKVSIYKNELGTLNTDRLLKIHRFLDEQQKKQVYELSEHISDFAEQECEDYKISLAVASRAMNQLQSSLKEKEDTIKHLLKICKIAGVPQILREHPFVLAGNPTNADIKWAEEALSKYLNENK